MKYQFDLLPEEYKSSSRNNFVIAIAVILAIIAIVSIGMNMAKNKASFKTIDDKIESARKTLQGKYDEISRQKPNSAKINEIKSKIEFINKNLDTPGSDVVAFLTSFERESP